VDQLVRRRFRAAAVAADDSVMRPAGTAPDMLSGTKIGLRWPTSDFRPFLGVGDTGDGMSAAPGGAWVIRLAPIGIHHKIGSATEESQLARTAYVRAASTVAISYQRHVWKRRFGGGRDDSGSWLLFEPLTEVCGVVLVGVVVAYFQLPVS
jgi:hypothetical protein